MYYWSDPTTVRPRTPVGTTFNSPFGSVYLLTRGGRVEKDGERCTRTEKKERPSPEGHSIGEEGTLP